MPAPAQAPNAARKRDGGRVAVTLACRDIEVLREDGFYEHAPSRPVCDGGYCYLPACPEKCGDWVNCRVGRIHVFCSSIGR